MTEAEILNWQRLFKRFLDEKYSDNPVIYKIGLGLMSVFIYWLDE